MNALAICVFSNVKTYVQMFVGIAATGFVCLWGGSGIINYFIFYVHGSYSGTGDVNWMVITSMTLAKLGILCFLLTAAVTTIAPPTANRMLPLRIVISMAFLLSLAYCGFLFGWSSDFFKGWSFSWLCALPPTLLLAVCERETWTYRIKKTIPHNFVFRMLVFPFYTGSPCGLAWIFLLFGGVALTAANGGILVVPFSGDLTEGLLALLFAFNYCVTAMLLRSFVFPKVSPGKTWAVAVVLLLFFTFGSILTYYLTYGDKTFDFGDGYSEHFLSALNPFLLMASYDQTYRTIAAIGWAILLIFPFIFWFGLRIREFTPSPPSDMMTLEDAVAAVKYADENPMVTGRRE